MQNLTTELAMPGPSLPEEQPNSDLPKPKPKRNVPTPSKTDVVLKKLRSAKGASIEQLVEATGWQAHSVRGFLSATVRKKLGLNLVSDVGRDEVRRYRIVTQAVGASS